MDKKESKTISLKVKNNDDFNDKELNDSFKIIVDVLEIEQEKLFVKYANIYNQLLNNFDINDSLIESPTSVSLDYKGIKLDLACYQDNELDALLKSYKNNQFILDPYYVFKIINDAKNILISMPNIRKLNLIDPAENGAIIVGDLRGNFLDLNHIIAKYGIPGAKYKYVFNGNYVDTGAKQIECLVILLYCFVSRPDCVFLNRGNHEDFTLSSNSLNFMNSFISDLRNKYGKFAKAIFNAAMELFSYLPLATIVSNLEDLRLFVVHGGISENTDLDYIENKLERNLYKRIVSSDPTKDIEQINNLLWSNPVRIEDGKVRPSMAKKTTGFYSNKETNFGCLFGVDITSSFCKSNSFNFIIRSHQTREKGYQEDHLRCYTLYSASNYLESNNYGAVIRLGTRESQIETYTYKNYINLSKNNVNNYMLRKFKQSIQLNKRILLENFQNEDKSISGITSLNSWANILSDSFSNNISAKHLIRLKDQLMITQYNNDINYLAFIRKYNNSSDKFIAQLNIIKLIDSLCNLYDYNCNNSIKLDEIIEKFNIIEDQPIKAECISFLKSLSIKSNTLDLNEFKKSYLNEMNDFFVDEKELTKKDLKTLMDRKINIKIETSDNKNSQNINSEDYYYDSECSEEGDVQFLSV
jgi:hypothetical protein